MSMICPKCGKEKDITQMTASKSQCLDCYNKEMKEKRKGKERESERRNARSSSSDDGNNPLFLLIIPYYIVKYGIKVLLWVLKPLFKMFKKKWFWTVCSCGITLLLWKMLNAVYGEKS